MALAREKRLPPLHLSLNVPSRPAVQEPAFRHANPPLAAPPSASSTPLARSSQFRLADFDRLAVLGRGNGGTVYKVRHRETPPPPSRRRLPTTSPPPRGSVVGRGRRSVEPPPPRSALRSRRRPLFPPWPRIQWRQLPGSAALVLHSNGDLLPPGFLLPRRHRRGGGPPEKTPSACPTAQAERLSRALNLLPREAGPIWSRDGPPPWRLGSSRSGG